MSGADRRRYEKALLAPSEVYAAPAELLGDAGLSVSEKVEILRRWSDIQRGMMRASGEGMPGGGATQLQDIVNALLQLGADPGDTD